MHEKFLVKIKLWVLLQKQLKQHRITSYNVCYTKLLRLNQGTDNIYKLQKRLEEVGFYRRITSYNVCYTKLLRLNHLYENAVSQKPKHSDRPRYSPAMQQARGEHKKGKDMLGFVVEIIDDGDFAGQYRQPGDSEKCHYCAQSGDAINGDHGFLQQNELPILATHAGHGGLATAHFSPESPSKILARAMRS